MKEHDLKELGEAILREVRTDITPKKLMEAIRKAHPDASKKEMIRAAFYALIANAEQHSESLSHFTGSQFNKEHRTRNCNNASR